MQNRNSESDVKDSESLNFLYKRRVIKCTHANKYAKIFRLTNKNGKYFCQTRNKVKMEE